MKLGAALLLLLTSVCCGLLSAATVTTSATAAINQPFSPITDSQSGTSTTGPSLSDAMAELYQGYGGAANARASADAVTSQTFVSATLMGRYTVPTEAEAIATFSRIIPNTRAGNVRVSHVVPQMGLMTGDFPIFWGPYLQICSSVGTCPPPVVVNYGSATGLVELESFINGVLVASQRIDMTYFNGTMPYTASCTPQPQCLPLNVRTAYFGSASAVPLTAIGLYLNGDIITTPWTAVPASDINISYRLRARASGQFFNSGQLSISIADPIHFDNPWGGISDPISVEVQSAPSEVPEPGTFGILGVGLCGLAAWRMRQPRK